MSARKVLLLEFNEITWTVIDRLASQGRLPNLTRMRAEGAWGSPEALERYPHLDPWVTWVTLHTGVDRSVHGATVLEQDAESIRAKRTWDFAAEAGRSVGVFGSISAYPPRKVPGFVVPGPFAPSDDTYPEYLRPVQRLNRRYTRIHGKVEGEGSPLEMLREGVDLFRLGLQPATAARILRQLAAERARPHLKWKRVALQPLINYDFFSFLYRRYRPEVATWHTNHAAHYMHHYWRAWDDAGFLHRSPPEEKLQFGAAVPHGYEVCDELLGRFMRLVDDDTVLVLASSMGQKPYVAEMFPKGRHVVRFKDIGRLLHILGARGVAEVVPIMVPQINIKIPDAAERARVMDLLGNSYRVGAEPRGAISFTETGDIVTVSPVGLAEREVDVRYHFPGAPNARAEGHAIDELFAVDAPTAKQGMHDPRGLVVFWGAGVERGLELDDVGPLDIAPTLLALAGVPVPPEMQGRVLSEIWGVRPRLGARAARA